MTLNERLSTIEPERICAAVSRYKKISRPALVKFLESYREACPKETNLSEGQAMIAGVILGMQLAPPSSRN